jgi:hypothetical protein
MPVALGGVHYILFSGDSGADVLKESQEIAVRVLNNELSISERKFAPTIPPVLQVEEHGPARCGDGAVQGRNVGNLNLKIDSTAVGVFERSGDELTTSRLLEHDLRPFAIQVRKPLFGSRKLDDETEDVNIKARASFNIGAVQLRYQPGRHQAVIISPHVEGTTGSRKRGRCVSRLRVAMCDARPGASRSCSTDACW